MEKLLRKTIATSKPGEICFVYTPKERINEDVFNLRFGPLAEVESDGVTYSLDKSTLQTCFKTPIPVLGTFDWTLCISPLAEMNIVSVILQTNPGHATQDAVIAQYAPEHAASTAGTSVVHFYSKSAAIAFMAYLL